MTHDLTVRFHGVRGSLPTPGIATAGVGGNTSCVEVVVGDTRIVLDAGTGLRGLGEELVAAGPSHTTVLLSHLHWDHIQGLPFFAPIYTPGHRVEVIAGPNGMMSLADALRRQMTPPFFPVSFDRVSAQLSARDARPTEVLRIGDATVRMTRLDHPNPVWGYRIEHAGRAVVYATDTEYTDAVGPSLHRLAAGADVLIFDAQYTPEEYGGAAGTSRVGWGHSTWSAGASLAHAAGVRQLVLFHHDPRRSDDAVAALEARARAAFPGALAAREGTELRVGADASSAAA
jgi:phosphoribosyl 1,2-cyclic phosphodiesterase